MLAKIMRSHDDFTISNRTVIHRSNLPHEGTLAAVQQRDGAVVRQAAQWDGRRVLCRTPNMVVARTLMMQPNDRSFIVLAGHMVLHDPTLPLP